jgi:hypothetical protein
VFKTVPPCYLYCIYWYITYTRNVFMHCKLHLIMLCFFLIVKISILLYNVCHYNSIGVIKSLLIIKAIRQATISLNLTCLLSLTFQKNACHIFKTNQDWLRPCKLLLVTRHILFQQSHIICFTFLLFILIDAHLRACNECVVINSCLILVSMH